MQDAAAALNILIAGLPFPDPEKLAEAVKSLAQLLHGAAAAAWLYVLKKDLLKVRQILLDSLSCALSSLQDPASSPTDD